MKVLVIGEKTSQVKAFAETLCGNYRSAKQAKYVYTYTGRWMSNSGTIDFTFLPLAGHITTIDTEKGYGWQECPPIKIASDKNALRFKQVSKYVKILRGNIDGHDELWLATDPDSEGDNIAYEAIEILKSKIQRGKIPIKRIWNSSLTQKEIVRAFLHPRPWEESLALAVQGRRLADAWLGFAGTREITLAARQVAQVKVLSVGRVQLPTLRLIVHRDFEHESFSPEDRWKLLAELATQNGQELIAEHKSGFFVQKETVDGLKRYLDRERTAKVSNIKHNESKTKPPIPLNTTAAVALLSKVLKVTAKKALDFMVELYNKGFLSYPRTENAMFKNGFPHYEIFNGLANHPAFKGLIAPISNMKQVRNNGKKKEAEDHDPIHPTGEIKGLANLDKSLFQAWNILTKYYLSLFYPDYHTSKTRVQLQINSEYFLAEGVEVISLGWQVLHDWQSRREKSLPTLHEGEVLNIKKLSIRKSQTKPPARWNESRLLLEMEKLRIGTKSSRADILNKLIQRKYVVRNKRQLISTNWGRALIASLEPIWPEIVTPKFTRRVEELMDEVASKSKPYSEMLKTLRKEYLKYHSLLLPKLPTYQTLLKKLDLNKQSTASYRVTPETNAILMQLISQQISEERRDKLRELRKQYLEKEKQLSRDTVDEEASINDFIDQISS